MLVAILTCTTLVCAVGWMKRYISCTAMIYYLKRKGYKLPNDKEIKECTQFVIEHLFK